MDALIVRNNLSARISSLCHLCIDRMLSWAAEICQVNGPFLSVAKSPWLYIFMTVTSGTRHPGLQGQEKVSHKRLSALDPWFLVLSSAHLLLPPCGVITNWQDRSSSCGQLVLICWTVWSLQNVKKRGHPPNSLWHGGGMGWDGAPLPCSKACWARVTEKARVKILPLRKLTVW